MCEEEGKKDDGCYGTIKVVFTEIKLKKKKKVEGAAWRFMCGWRELMNFLEGANSFRRCWAVSNSV